MCVCVCVVVIVVAAVVSHISSLFQTSAGARGYETGRTRRREEKKTEKGICHIRTYESTLSPYGVTARWWEKLKTRVHTTRKDKENKKVEKTSNHAREREKNRELRRPQGFPHPPTMPEGSVSDSRRPGTPNPHCTPGCESQGCSAGGGRNKTNK